jgi:hypothetical protein
MLSIGGVALSQLHSRMVKHDESVRSSWTERIGIITPATVVQCSRYWSAWPLSLAHDTYFGRKI